MNIEDVSKNDMYRAENENLSGGSNTGSKGTAASSPNQQKDKVNIHSMLGNEYKTTS